MRASGPEGEGKQGTLQWSWHLEEEDRAGERPVIVSGFYLWEGLSLRPVAEQEGLGQAGARETSVQGRGSRDGRRALPRGWCTQTPGRPGHRYGKAARGKPGSGPGLESPV